MKKLAIVNINNPGIQSSLDFIDKASEVVKEYNITLFHKSDRQDFDVPNRKYNKIKDLFEEIWNEFDVILCFLSTGIIIRSIADLIKSKSSDPAVVSMSFDLTKIVPLLSGHIGGGNEFCEAVIRLLPDCVGFISTATDQNNIISFDMYAKDRGFKIVNLSKLAGISTSLINGETINVFSHRSILDDIKNYCEQKDNGTLNLIDINDYDFGKDYNYNVLISPIKCTHSGISNPMIIKIHNLNLGMGFHKDMDNNILLNSLQQFLFEHNLNLSDVSSISTYEKKRDDPALLWVSDKIGVPVKYYDDEDINNLTCELSKSKANKFFNIKGVSEPCAILGSKYKTCFLKKHVYHGSVTIACGF